VAEYEVQIAPVSEEICTSADGQPQLAVEWRTADMVAHNGAQESVVTLTSLAHGTRWPPRSSCLGGAAPVGSACASLLAHSVHAWR
jgi:hypothetical protein